MLSKLASRFLSFSLGINLHRQPAAGINVAAFERNLSIDQSVLFGSEHTKKLHCITFTARMICKNALHAAVRAFRWPACSLCARIIRLRDRFKVNTPSRNVFPPNALFPPFFCFVLKRKKGGRAHRFYFETIFRSHRLSRNDGMILRNLIS